MSARAFALATLALLGVGLLLWAGDEPPAPSAPPGPSGRPEPPGPPVAEVEERLAQAEAGAAAAARALEALDPPGATPAGPSRRAAARAALRAQVEALEAADVEARLEAGRRRRLRELGLDLTPGQEQRVLELVKEGEAEVAALTRRMLEERTGHLPETQAAFDDLRARWQERIRAAVPGLPGEQIAGAFFPVR